MTEHDTPPSSRRPLSSRGHRLIRWLLQRLLATAITPNQISVASVAISAAGAWALLHAQGSPLLFLATALCVQLRLLCNLLDGMVAVEGGRGSPVGALYNEIPDRLADSLFLVAWGYACAMPWLGWAAALAAACTAYIRTLGGALGQAQDFRGPMAKQHRMAALSVACLIAIPETLLHTTSNLLEIGLWVVMLGSVWTCIARTRAIAGQLRTA
jgi:phosphatidylglycerophosphate synthase